MSRIYGHWSEQRVQFALAIFVDISEHIVIQLVDAQDANPLLCQLRPQLLIPTRVLFFDELVGQAVEQLPLLDHRQAVGRGGVIAVFKLLQQSAHAHLEELVEIAGRDRQEFHPLQERIKRVLSFLQYAPIKIQPGFFAVNESSRTVVTRTDHKMAME